MTANLDGAVLDALWAELRGVIGQLGADGGQMSPSIYESAQVLRLCPACADEQAVAAWLLQQQGRDGSWGGPGLLLYREVPTLAALLALHLRGRTPATARAVQRGLSFLQRRAHRWRGPLPATIPVGFELIWPQLLTAAQAAELPLTLDAYAEVFALGARKRELIDQVSPDAQSPAVFSWEAWGTQPDPALVNAARGVGGSAAATAAWWQAAGDQPGLEEARRAAASYLHNAALSTPLQIPGIVPTAWPMELMEQSFALHVLLMADLLLHEELRAVVPGQIATLAQAAGPVGIGFNRHFMADGDDTAAGLAVLAAYGAPVAPAMLAPFEHPTHFSTYPFEFHSAPIVTAKAAHALHCCGQDVTRWREAVVRDQLPGGLWEGDKWNLSRLYASAIALMALRGAGYAPAKTRCCKALVASQRSSGGWGSGAKATMIETAFAILGLYTLACDDLLDDGGWRALWRGHDLLLARWQAEDIAHEKVWICKELFTPRRIDQTYVLAALVAPVLLPQHARRHLTCIPTDTCRTQ